MTEKQVSLLTKFASENGICTFTLTCMFYIAAKEAAKPEIIRDYGIIACQELRELGDEMNSVQKKWFYQIQQGVPYV